MDTITLEHTHKDLLGGKSKFNNTIIFGGSNSSDLAGKVAKHGNFIPGEIIIKQFPDSEIYIRILSDVKNKECAVIQSMQNNDNLIELLIILDALNDFGAGKITAVIPYLGYARQDKRFKKGEAMSSRTILKLIGSFADEIITVNCHFLNEAGTFNVGDYFKSTSLFFEKNIRSDNYDNIDFNKKIKETEDNPDNQEIILKNIDAFPVLAEYFKNKFNKNLVVIAPDKGALHYARRAAGIIGCEFDFLEKTRLSGDTVKIEPKNLDIKDKDVLILDDMISTGGTIVESAKVIKKHRAKTINVGCVHGIFSKGTEMFEGVVDELVCTNTLNTDVSKVDISEAIAKEFVKK